MISYCLAVCDYVELCFRLPGWFSKLTFAGGRDKEQEWKCFPYNPASLIMADSGVACRFRTPHSHRSYPLKIFKSL